MKLLLYSGGVESTCLIKLEKPDRALFIDYGQLPAKGELSAATKIANLLEVPLDVIDVDISKIGSGELVGRDTTSYASVSEAWPFRNQFFLTVASMKYAGSGLSELQIGTVKSDSVHPDGTPEFIQAINALTKCELPEIEVAAPAIHMTTEQLVIHSGLGRDVLSWAFSCHRGEIACGTCRGCSKTLDVLRKVF